MIGIIGAGNMGQAIALRLRRKILVSDADSSKLRFIRSRRISIAKNNIDLIKRVSVVIVAVKPQDIQGVLKEIAPYVKRKLIISIAAGVGTKLIEKILESTRVVRVMPNMPAQVGSGISSITRGKSASKKDLDVAQKIFLNLGEVVEVGESLMDAVTAVSGSGPAYYFLFTDLLEKAARSVGLKKDLAEKLAASTFIGAAEAARCSGLSMQDFVKKVASKGGTTQTALNVFEKEGLERIVKQAVRAACKRSKELAVNDKCQISNDK